MPNPQPDSARHFSLALMALLLMLVALPTALLAEYQPVAETGIEITHPRPLYDRRSRTYWLDVTVRHQGSAELTGPLRLVVDSANKTLINGHGSTVSGQSYADLSTAADARFAPGDSLGYRLGFQGGRGQLLAALRLERDVPEVANQPPVAAAGDDQTQPVNSLVEVDGSGSSDPEGADLAYRWGFVAKPASSSAALDDPTASRPSFTADQPGTYELSLVVDDGDSSSAPATIRVLVTNAAPTANAGVDQLLTLPEGATTLLVTLDGRGSTDPEGAIARYDWTGSPNPADAQQPTVELGVGSYSFGLIVYDAFDVASPADTVEVVIASAPPTNQQPIAEAGQDQTVQVPLGEQTATLSLDGSGSIDPDGSVARWVWTGDVDPEDVAQPELTLAPGVWTLHLVVYDAQDLPSALDTVVVTVLEPPEASPPQLQVDATTLSVDEGETLSLGVSATDVDGDVVSLSATPSLDNVNFTSTPSTDPTGTLTFTPGEDQAGTYVVELTARDRWGLTDRELVEIQVEPINQAPEIAVGSEFSVDEGRQLAITFTASDPDGDTPVLSVIGLPDNAVLLPAQRLIQFSPDFEQAGVYDLVLTADDGDLHTEAQLRVTVADVAPPGGDELTLTVDPAQSPTFATRSRITGAVNGSGLGQSAPTPFALITGLAPTQARQGETVEVTLTGAPAGRWQTNFIDGQTDLDLGGGITVDGLTVSGPDLIQATVSIDGDAKVGQRQLRASSGDEIAVSVPAFSVLPGVATLSGVLVDSETGSPIDGALISIEGTNLRATSGTDGSYSLAGVPSGEHQLLVNAPNHALVRTTVEATAGDDLSLGEISAEPRVLPADARPSASVYSLVARGIGDPTRPMSFAAAQDITRDALMLVGGRDIGILDEDGNQQNPLVGEDVPFWSFNEDTVFTIAERMVTGERRTLAEVLETHTGLWDWGPGEPPTLLDWLAAIQAVVDQAWFDPGNRRYALLFLLFNPDRSVLPSPPTIVADLPLNALQATLMELTLIRYASRTIDPEALQDAVVVDYPELAGALNSSAAKPSLAGRLLDVLVPPAFAADPVQAVIERTEEEIHVRQKIPLVAMRGRNAGINDVRYQWSLTGSVAGSNPTFTRIDESTAYFTADRSGVYKVRLTVSALGHGSAEEDVEITVGDPCDDSFTQDLSNADATWEEVGCFFTRASSRAVATGAIKGQVWGWLSGAAPLSKIDAKVAASNNILAFNQSSGLRYPPGRITSLRGLEEALPGMFESARQTQRTVQITRFSATLLASSTAGVIQGQAATLSRNIMYRVLDKVIEQLVDSMRPAPPGDVSVDPVIRTGTVDEVASLVTFEISPTHDRYLHSGPRPGEPGSAYQAFYYMIYRVRADGVVERIYIGAPGTGGLTFFNTVADGKLYFAFVDDDPPEGQVSYFVKARRIIGKGPVITENWSESEFWFGQILGVLSPPGANQYSFAKAMSTRGINLLKQVRLQSSDPSPMARIFIPRQNEGVKLPVQLASTPEWSRYGGDILLSVPDADSVFTFGGGAPGLLMNSGFKVPYQAGIAVDSLGNIYMDNAASDARFGGRIWRWDQDLRRSLFGSVQYFSRLLMFSRPAGVQSMAAGWLDRDERLYIADRASNRIRELVILSGGRFPPDPGHYVSQPVTAEGQVQVQSDTSLAVNSADSELLVTDGDNLLRYRNPSNPQFDHLFPADNSPFGRITGIDADRAGNLYVSDGNNGEIIVVPRDKRTDEFYGDLLSEPWVRDLYSLATGLNSPAELRVAGHQKAMMWLDNDGPSHYGFGFSGRILLPDGSPLTGARVSVEERLGDFEVLTNSHGIFKLRGLRGPNLPDEVALLVRARDGRVGQFQLLLNAVGHTFSEAMEFVGVTPPDPSGQEPPGRVEIPPIIVESGEPTVVHFPFMPTVTAPLVEIVGPADGAETDLDEVQFAGFIMGGTLLSAKLERNGVIVDEDFADLVGPDGSFDTRVSVGDGATRLRVIAQIQDAEGNFVEQRSEPVTVLKVDSATTGALSGWVADEETGLPVPGASVFAYELGISALTDRNGIWQMPRVPPGDVFLEVVP